ncbi:MAG: DUF2220 family protein [Trichloromonas sp.]|jgi:hypothetical protein|nr:DUF2220 family protein [Trichloromonas sp.]
MIAPGEIKAKAEKIWQSGLLLRAHLRGEELFPLDIPFRKPTGKEALERFAEVRAWMLSLREAGKASRGFGYSLDFSAVNHRQLGEQRFPARIYFETPADLLRIIGRQRDFDCFRELAEPTLAAHPSLRPWLERSPFNVLDHRESWPRLLAVCAYFLHNPVPGRYLRELDIPGVDSKFVERNRRILREMLDILLPPAAIDRSVTSLAGSGFERRFGLRYDEPLIRLRLLDPVPTAPFGLTDLSIPLSQFLAFDFPCRRVFITENKINGLSFPQVADALVIFGLGYGIQALKEADWLRRKEIVYWGDIDTHGFAILSQLRGYFPRVRSMLMDRETLLAFRHLWVAEEADKRCLAELPHLDEEERRLCEDLRGNGLGDRVRLEQERIAFAWLRDWLERTL